MARTKARKRATPAPDLRDIKTPGIADRLNAERPTEPAGFTPYAEPMDPEPSAQGGELSSTPEEKLPAQSAVKSIRTSRDSVSQSEIDELNALHLEILASARKTIKKMIILGGKLWEIKKRMRHGQWGPFVQRNLHYTVRTASRYMKVYHHRDNPALSEDPEGFLSQVYGNEAKQLKDRSDVEEGKSDVDVRNENTDKECSDSGEELPSSRPAKVSPEEWSGMMLVKELGKTLDGYLSQPVAETLKLQVLIHAYHILAARLEPQAKKLGLTLEQALGQEWRNI